MARPIKIGVNDITVEYPQDKGAGHVALKDFSMQVHEGEFLSVIGPSGCGKSTLLSVLEGIRFPSKGTVEIDGHVVEGPGTDRGVVFQQKSLFPWMSAERNIAFGIEQTDSGLTRRERLEVARTYLAKVGLEGHGHRYPSELSGGMQQRVAIARAFAMDTEILLMDEPFSALDPSNRLLLQEMLIGLWEGDAKGGKKTVVFVTHDIDEAMLLSDRICVLTQSPGRVAEEVTVGFERPRSYESISMHREYAEMRKHIMLLFSSAKSFEDPGIRSHEAI